MIEDALVTRREAALRDALRSMSMDDLLDLVGEFSIIDFVIEEISDDEIEKLLAEPKHAGILKRHLLAHGDDGKLTAIRLCGGAESPAKERELYELALRGEA